MKEFIEKILSEYEDYEEIGSGGQKVVYRVTHPEYGVVALKLGSIDTEVSRERIRREVGVLQQLDSDYYPDILEADFSNGHFVIIEEYIDGRPLSEFLEEYSDPKEALELLQEIVNGLSEIWDLDILHRDVKPNNILITTEREVKIIDLGVAKLLNMNTITDDLGAPRTDSYASPEQLRYEKKLNELRTDQFLLGIILAQLLYNGVHPFSPDLTGRGESVPHNIVAGEWAREPLKDFPCVYEIVDRLLGEQPYLRYPDSQSLLKAVDECLEVLK